MFGLSNRCADDIGARHCDISRARLFTAAPAYLQRIRYKRRTLRHAEAVRWHDRFCYLPTSFLYGDTRRCTATLAVTCCCFGRLLFSAFLFAPHHTHAHAPLPRTLPLASFTALRAHYFAVCADVACDTALLRAYQADICYQHCLLSLVHAGNVHAPAARRDAALYGKRLRRTKYGTTAVTRASIADSGAAPGSTLALAAPARRSHSLHTPPPPPLNRGDSALAVGIGQALAHAPLAYAATNAVAC